MDDQRRVAPVPDTTRRPLGQTEAPFRLAQQDQAVIGRDQAAVEGGRYLLAPDGWQMEGKKAIVAIVGYGGRGALVVREVALSLFGKKDA